MYMQVRHIVWWCMLTVVTHQNKCTQIITPTDMHGDGKRV